MKKRNGSKRTMVVMMTAAMAASMGIGRFRRYDYADLAESLCGGRKTGVATERKGAV